LFYPSQSAVIVEVVHVDAERHMIAWAVSGIFVAFAVPMPLNDILLHALHYCRPELQRYYIRILWLVPIYAVQSWLALRFYPNRVYFATARELYESFGEYQPLVLRSILRHLPMLRIPQSFGASLSCSSKYFPNREELYSVLVRHGPTVKPMFPFCRFRPWHLGRPFVERISFGILQVG